MSQNKRVISSKFALLATATTPVVFLATACNPFPPVSETGGVDPQAPVITEVDPSVTGMPPVGEVPADPGIVPKVETKEVEPNGEMPEAPPVEMAPGSDLVPAAPGPSEPTTATSAAEAAPATEPAVPAAEDGFSPIDIQIRANQGDSLIQAFSPGILACEKMVENILVRDNDAGGAEHVVNLAIRELGGSAAGVAETPPASFYDQARTQGLVLTLDDDLPNQFSVCAVFVHELMHTLGVQHTGNGLLSPVLSEDQLFLDGPIADELGKVGYRFAGSLQEEINQTQGVALAQLLDDFSGTSASALQGQQT